ncbi:DUF4760 domain-containing protein [Planococcus sp. 1R117A]|uniref:DUF4760 domain-containing protein n=1 Tax=Planococcus sp. 1R117A TaxID=3447020 RepID=UPI003EDB9B1B
MLNYIKDNRIKSGLMLLGVIGIILFFIYISNLTGYSTSKFKDILEIMYFITNSLLLLVAVIGLKQLTIAKNNSKMNAKRESYHLAAEQCTHFLNYIIPLADETILAMKAKSFDDFGEVEISMKDGKVTFDNKFNEENFELMSIKEVHKMVYLFNAFEAYSLFFTHRVAEEEVAFSTIGSTYCSVVKRFIPVILNASNFGEKGYSNIIKLYTAWNNKLEKQKLLEERVENERKEREIVTIDFKSLGT